MNSDPTRNARGLRIIQTARTENAINQAALEGFRPLVKPVVRSEKIRQAVWVWQNMATGEIQTVGDLRRGPPPPGWKRVIEPTFYYPHAFPEPFAAYLLPPDLQPGERVWLKDLIEDFVARRWNANGFRLASWEAVWDGTDLIVDYDEERDCAESIG